MAAASLAAAPAGVRFSDVTVTGGVRIRYAERGPRDGRAVLLLHGYTDSWFSFSGVIPLLPADWRVIVPDQRGHGDSDKPQGGYAVDDFACDALELLDALGAGTATVAGHSMGGFIAQRMAMLAPERVDRVVIAGSARVARNPAVEALYREVLDLQEPLDPEFARRFVYSMSHRPVAREFLETAVSEARKVPVRVWKAALRELMEAGPWEVRRPALVLWGDRDEIFSRAEQDDLVAAIPDAQLKVIEGVAHGMQWEVPEDFVRELVAFHL